MHVIFNNQGDIQIYTQQQQQQQPWQQWPSISNPSLVSRVLEHVLTDLHK